MKMGSPVKGCVLCPIFGIIRGPSDAEYIYSLFAFRHVTVNSPKSHPRLFPLFLYRKNGAEHAVAGSALSVLDLLKISVSSVKTQPLWGKPLSRSLEI